jgi:hypothetical protein
VKIWLRADSGFARDALMSSCEENQVDYVFGLARNARLEPMIAAELAEAETAFAATGKAARVFKELAYRTKDSWARERRVVANAEHLEKGANPRFVVTSLTPEEIGGQELYERVYSARGEMENRFTLGWRSTASRNLVATSASSSRSRFFENVEWSQTGSSIPSPTNQLNSRL